MAELDLTSAERYRYTSSTYLRRIPSCAPHIRIFVANVSRPPPAEGVMYFSPHDMTLLFPLACCLLIWELRPASIFTSSLGLHLITYLLPARTYLNIPKLYGPSHA